jgi:HK97 family phage portal protein
VKNQEEKRSFFEFIFGKTYQEEVAEAKPTKRLYTFSGINQFKVRIFNDTQQVLKNDSVKACIKVYSDLIKKSRIEILNLKNKDIERVLRNPNEFQTMEEFLEQLTIQLLVNNNVFIYQKTDSKYNLKELHIVDYHSAEVMELEDENVPVDDRFFIRFNLRNWETKTVNLKELIHIRQNITDGGLISATSLDDLSDVLAILKNTDALNIDNMGKSGIREFILETQTAIHEEDIQENIKKIIDNIYTDGGITIYPSINKMNLKELGNKPGDKLTKDFSTEANEAIQRIYNFFNVNEEMVKGKWTEESLNYFIQNKIESMLQLISSKFTKRLLTKRQIEEQNASIRFYVVANKLETLEASKKVAAIKSLVDIGVLKRNEIRKILGFEPLDGAEGEEIIQSLNYMQSSKITEYKLNQKEKSEGETENEE